MTDVSFGGQHPTPFPRRVEVRFTHQPGDPFARAAHLITHVAPDGYADSHIDRDGCEIPAQCPE